MEIVKKKTAVDNQFELTCGHCKAVFIGTYKQWWNQRQGLTTPHCSPACRMAASSAKAQAQALREGKTLRKGVLTGPCKKCGSMFESRIDKLYCSMNCYTTSDQFRQMQSQYWAPSEVVKAKISRQLRTGENAQCIECGEGFYRKKSDATRRKFCTKVCYRSYMAKRFDRWIANPEGMALPQCYDEFLDRDRLQCIVHGCDWEGIHLTTHVNQAHGLPATDFKRAAGFNLSTGVIARPLAKVFQSRELRGAVVNVSGDALDLAHAAQQGSYIRYISREACEHQKKARAMLGPGPTRICKGCASEFVQSTPTGRTLYCSVSCRTSNYAKKTRVQRKNTPPMEAT
ncbi:hypothetical protein KC887_08010 [Candidatus Kaiserbacteria bacterium]|nr:hypothetical protein [Candidatus Kaiserbacteria bacterium]